MIACTCHLDTKETEPGLPRARDQSRLHDFHTRLGQKVKVTQKKTKGKRGTCDNKQNK